MSPDSAATAAAGDGTSQSPAKVPRPEKLDASYWDEEKGEAKFDAISEALEAARAAKEAAEGRLADIPADASGYEVVLPENVKLPEGASIKNDDPMLARWREVAKEKGLTKGEFNAAVALYVEGQIASHAQYQARLAAEAEKLGPNAEARTQAVLSAGATRFGEAFKAVVPILATANGVAVMEKLLNSSSTGGFSQSGREEPRSDGRPENWESMSSVDRRTWQIQQNMNPGR